MNMYPRKKSTPRSPQMSAVIKIDIICDNIIIVMVMYMSHGGSSLLQVHVFSHGGTLREIKMKQFEVLRLKKLPLVN